MNNVQKFLDRLNFGINSELDEGFTFDVNSIGRLGVKHNCDKKKFCVESFDDKEIEYECQMCSNDNPHICTLPLSRIMIIYAEYQQVYMSHMMQNIDKRLQEIEKAVFTSKESRAIELALEANVDVNNLKTI